MEKSLQEILSNVDFEVPTGARAVIVGPNGCGKTTLLTTIADRDTVEGSHSELKSFGRFYWTYWTFT